jgi:glycosyltransferase involved in cell wall biosynthesis
MATISVVISAFNEQEKLARCLASVSWADEIIVIDNSSTDKTAHIAKKMGATVYERPNNPMLNVNKNFGFSKATSDWIFCLDADEEVPEELAREIKKTIKDPGDAVGFWMPRKNIIFGKWIRHGLWWPDQHLRLFARNKGRFAEKHVHEYVDVAGPTATLAAPFVHHNYESISQYLRKLDTLYTENEVKNLLSANYQFVWSDVIRFPVSDFVKIFFAQEGYKDGLHGLVLALLQAFYSFVVAVKLWEKSGFVERSITSEAVSEQFVWAKREIHFWSLTAHIKQTSSFIKRIVLRVRKKVL